MNDTTRHDHSSHDHHGHDPAVHHHAHGYQHGTHLGNVFGGLLGRHSLIPGPFGLSRQRQHLGRSVELGPLKTAAFDTGRDRQHQQAERIDANRALDLDLLGAAETAAAARLSVPLTSMSAILR